MPKTLSAVVVSYNRAAIIGTCLRALWFADEVIVVDKTSTDGTAEIAARHADQVVSVPWTPTVEETRAFAVAQSTGDWILCLDDDECLSPESPAGIRAALAAPEADIYRLPLLHYILGEHHPAAYYWPEHHPRLFRRGAVAFSGTVHGGMRLCSRRVAVFPPESGVAIHHLSHRDVQEWVEKCNRYTSRPDRLRVEHAGHDLAAFAHARIDHWQERSKDRAPGRYPAGVAVLRAVYDIVDRLKTWEEERGLDGAAAFARVCAELDTAYAAPPGEAARVRPPDEAARAGVRTEGCPAPPGPDQPAGAAALSARIGALRSAFEAKEAEVTQWSAEAARCAGEAAKSGAAVARLEAELAAARERHKHVQQALRIEQERLAAIEGSRSWRATAGARRLAERAKRLRRGE